MLTKSQPSGKMGSLIHVVGPLAIVGAAVFGFPYEFLISVAPTVKLAFVIVVFGALGVGAISYLGVKFGKCRNVPVAAAIGLTCGVVAICASHFCAYRLSGALEKGSRSATTSTSGRARAGRSAWELRAGRTSRGSLSI